MPGKYSHSVVLADYSSRGIINLPNDQHVAYLRTSPYPASQRSRRSSNPWSDKSPGAQTRAQSALAYPNRLYLNSDPRSSPARRVIIDTTLDPGNQTPTAFKSQRPSTSHHSHPASNQAIQSPPRHLKDSVYARTTTAPTSDTTRKVSPSVSREPQIGLRSSTSNNNVSRIRAQDFLREVPIPPSQLQAHIPATPQRKLAGSTTNISSVVLAPAAEINSKPGTTRLEPDHGTAQNNLMVKSVRPGTVLQRQSSQETQIFVPRGGVAEPDFAGFSDAEELPISYFDQTPKSASLVAQRATPRIGQHSDRILIPSPSGPSTSGSDSKAKTYRSMSTEQSESETAEEAGSSPLYSSGKLDSLTSSSTVSSKGNVSQIRGGKPVEVKRVADKSVNQEWKLPEIGEDRTFDPDFFTQGPSDLVRPASPDESVDSFLDRPLGTVSAGRDFDFTKDIDQESEVDAACPPDIGRFRGSNDFGTSSSFQAKDNDTTTAAAAGMSTTTAKAKKVGFFARLRSRTKLQH